MSFNLKWKPITRTINYGGTFSEPAFKLLRGELDVLGSLYNAFKSFGTRLADFSFAPTAQRYSDMRIECLFPPGKGLVQWRLEEVTGYFDNLLNQQDEDLAVSLLKAAVNVVSELLPNLEIKTHTIYYASHGLLETKTPLEFISTFSKPPPDGPQSHQGSAIAYYFGETETCQSSSVTIDRSQLIADGLFFRIDVRIDGKGKNPDQIHDLAGSTIDSLSKRFGLITAEG